MGKKYKKKLNKELEKIKQRLDDKYIVKPYKTKGTNKELEKKRMTRYHDRVWRGWRESDGQESPVKVMRIDDLEK